METPLKKLAVYEDFAKLDIRVGRIVAVEPFLRARTPAYKVAVDFGAIGTKWSSAQITSYQPDDLIGSDVVCVVNLPPRNIAGFISEILVLGARDAAGSVVLLSPRSEIERGEAVF